MNESNRSKADSIESKRSYREGAQTLIDILSLAHSKPSDYFKKPSEVPSSTTSNNHSNQNASGNNIERRQEIIRVPASSSKQWQSTEKNGKIVIMKSKNSQLSQMKQTMNSILRQFNSKASDEEINKTRRRLYDVMIKYENGEELISSKKIRSHSSVEKPASKHDKNDKPNEQKKLKNLKPTPKSQKSKKLEPSKVIENTIEPNKAHGLKVPQELLRLMNTDEYCSSPPRHSKRKCRKIERFSLEKYEQPKRPRRKSCPTEMYIPYDIQDLSSHAHQAIKRPQTIYQTPADDDIEDEEPLAQRIRAENKEIAKKSAKNTHDLVARKIVGSEYKAKNLANNEHEVIAKKSAGPEPDERKPNFQHGNDWIYHTPMIEPDKIKVEKEDDEYPM